MKILSRGMSLVSVMVAASIMLILISVLSRSMGTMFKATKSVEKMQDLEVLRLGLAQSIGCRETLGVPVNGTAAMCSSLADEKSQTEAGKYQLRNTKGENISTVGGWYFRVSCKKNDLGFNSLYIEVKNSKPDPLTNVVYNYRDLYNGASNLCVGFLDPVNPCKGTDIIMGYAGATPVCGKPGGFGNITLGQKIAAGGNYQIRPYVSPGVNTTSLTGPYCRTPNPKTGSCSCPAGYIPFYISEWAASYYSFNGVYCDGTPSNGYSSNNPPQGGCGYVSFLCLPNE